MESINLMKNGTDSLSLFLLMRVNNKGILILIISQFLAQSLVRVCQMLLSLTIQA